MQKLYSKCLEEENIEKAIAPTMAANFVKNAKIILRKRGKFSIIAAKLFGFLRPIQKKLFKRLCKKFKGNTLISKGNFILVRGVAPVMLVAHLTPFIEQPVKDICLSADKNILMSPQGIGGDARCGCYSLVKIYKSAQIKPWLLFTCCPVLTHSFRFLQCSKRSYRNESPLLKFASSKSVHSNTYYCNEEVNCCDRN